MRSSRDSRPTWIPGLNLLMYIERVPNDSTALVTAKSKPAMIEAISITVTTPMITPMTVRNDRNLLARSVARAIQRFSRMSDLNNFIGPFGVRRLDGAFLSFTLLDLQAESESAYE